MTTEHRDALKVSGIRKSYVEGVPVLDGVDLTVAAATITALVGANGSGKSTLVKILSGYHEADAGEVEIRGELVSEITPELLRTSGVRFVHQDSTIVPGISVLENLSVGGYETSGGRIRWRRERRRIRALLAEWAIEAEPDADVTTLSAAANAKLAVLKAIRMRPGDEPVHAIVLDEPTAALGPDDADELLTWLRMIATEQGVGILFISHRIEELLAYADRVVVLRGGRIVADAAARDLDADALVEHIVGAALETYYPDRPAFTDAPTVLAVVGARGGGVKSLDLEVAAGETVGITGLPGSGFEDVPLVLVDPRMATGGTLAIDGAVVRLERDQVSARTRLGLALVPADRKRTALAMDLSVRENVMLPLLARFRRAGWHRLTAERREAQALIERFRVAPASTAATVRRLSGGNQQKVVLAKWLSARPKVLVVHEPTQAVDVGAKAEIFGVLADVAADGVATVIVSVEHEDLAHLCDRVLVMDRGRVVAELRRSEGMTGASITAATLVSSAGG